MAAATIKLNHGEETTVFCQPVETFLQEAKRAQPGSPYYCVGVAHCHCSSPCQGFSLVNTAGSEEAKDANNKLCHTFPEIVITSKMTTGTFENVAGILQQERVHYVQEMFETFIKNNYKARLAGTKAKKSLSIALFLSSHPCFQSWTVLSMATHNIAFELLYLCLKPPIHCPNFQRPLMALG